MRREIVFDQSFYEALRRLEIVAREPSGGRLEGARTSRRPGAGVEYADWRPYAPGDDPRAIDWRALARLGSAFVRLRAREEASQVWILVDASASMGVGRPRKFTHARRLAGALAAIALARMDAVTAGFLLGRECRLGPRVTGTEALATVLRFLEDGHCAGACALEAAWGDFLERTQGPGVLLVLSDLWGDESLAGVLRRSAERGCEGAVLQVLHPDEIAPGRGGWSRMYDAESGAVLEMQTGGAARESYVRACAEYCDEQKRAAAAAGFRYALLGAGEPVHEAVLGTLRRARILA